MFYKYRGLSNFQYTVDILVNKRLFAADFKSLNDPMEGHYTYEDGALEQWQVETIYSEKNEYRLTALSETPDNMLMWSYYAESHSGIVIGVELDDQEADLVPIDYVDNLAIEKNHHDVAKRILSKKYRLWQHEHEHRVFIRRQSFVHVKLKELIFGVSTKDDSKKLLTSVAKNFNPGIIITTMTRDKLNWIGAYDGGLQGASHIHALAARQ